MSRIRAATLLACVMALVGGVVASAQMFSSTTRVFTAGHGVYHIAACPDAPPGYARCFAHIVTDRTGQPLVNRFVPNRVERLVPAGRPVPIGFGPYALTLVYNPTAALVYPNVGKPTTVIAIVDAFGYPNAEKDLNIYRQTFGLGPCTTANGCFKKVNQAGVQGAYPPPNLGWEGESALDVDMASAMCPKCKIMLVETTNNNNANLAAGVRTAARLGAHVISNSYGGPEAGSQTLNPSYNHPGVAVTASTGDCAYDNTSSDSNCSPLAKTANFPATSQFVTAVGGTSLGFDPRGGYFETAWSDAGSGCSKLYPKPPWQSKITLCTKRMEADVSAVADPATGVVMFGPSSGHPVSAFQVFGGTSVAAPLVGGLYGAKGGAVTLGSQYKSGLFFDVVQGNNGVCGGTFFCNAKPGYDGPTGIGAVRGLSGF